MNNYNTIEDIEGKVRELVVNKLGSDSDALIQFATDTVSSGGCETCWFDWDEFVILENGVEVYRTSQSYSPFGELQYWLESEDV